MFSGVCGVLGRYMVGSAMKVECKSYDFVPEGYTLRTLRDQIVVKVLPLKFSETILADYRGNPVRGIVVAVGPGRYPNRYSTGRRDGKDFRTQRESLRFRPTEVKVGDTVELGGLEFQGYAFPRIMMDGQEHVICSEQDVAGVHI